MIISNLFQGQMYKDLPGFENLAGLKVLLIFRNL